jgi:hypothetical protein
MERGLSEDGDCFGGWQTTDRSVEVVASAWSMKRKAGTQKR